MKISRIPEISLPQTPFSWKLQIQFNKRGEGMGGRRPTLTLCTPEETRSVTPQSQIKLTLFRKMVMVIEITVQGSYAVILI